MYADLISTGPVFRNKYIWKIKVPLKIKKSSGILRGVVLTKDNLAKRRWRKCKKCCFCDQEGTIHHLFLSGPFAMHVWRTIHIPYNLSPPTSITNVFGNWLGEVHLKLKAQILLDLCMLVHYTGSNLDGVSRVSGRPDGIHTRKLPRFRPS